jgi:sec-independent protein translocase protein TatA
MGLDNPLHIAFLVVILLLVFGARRLPEIGRSLGSGLREFKQSINGESHSPEPQQPTLPPAASAAPAEQARPVEQAQPSAPQPAQQPAPQPAPPVTAQPGPQAEDAFAQREPATTDRS